MEQAAITRTVGVAGGVRLVDGGYEDAQEAAGELAEREDRALIHPFADPDVIVRARKMT